MRNIIYLGTIFYYIRHGGGGGVGLKIKAKHPYVILELNIYQGEL